MLVAPQSAGIHGRADSGQKLADVVADRIERLIVEGVLKVGQVLPSERRLTQKLGVSRTAIREGIKILRARGMITTSHGRGSYVADLTGELALPPMMHLLTDHPRTLYDLLEVRLLLEAEAARLAALRGTAADFTIIGHRYNEMLASHGNDVDASVHAKLDHAFHLSICEASHNPVLVHMLRSLTDLLLSSVYASVNNLYHRASHKRKIDLQHRRLYRAVITKAPESARKAAAEHVRMVSQSLQELEQEESRLVRATLRLEGWK
ncbi:transcriptional regulator GlcC [Burkholderia cenocepacia]|uniref:transcriptional regulator GlcC n=1 Tax=Burkholderia cenocepacia TaxID=95486 RepID=UPI002857B24B|nr:transcriptional regulator GlcC [Burkholderia cenocepacia]MDR5644417.1 transcriptional regulator GlcC [Burkholderia cenocepacia]